MSIKNLYGVLIIQVIIIIVIITGNHAAFTGKDCLNSHNVLRAKHDKTQLLKYSKELEKSAQTYADQLATLDDDKSNPFPTRELPKKRRDIPATTNPFFHKEMWDGEVLFPLSRWDLNKGRKIPIGESIHKFCCYSFPYCPSDFFHGLNFPPSAKGVVGHWYKEVSNYDFAKGKKKNEMEDVKHFTNIVWKKTTEVGCAQSKKSKKGCIYTVARYQVEGSVGWEDDYKKNVGSTTPVAGKKDGSNQSYLTAFLIVLFIVLILVAVILVYIKRQRIRALYAEYQIKRGAKKAEASLRDDYDEESIHGRKSIIYKPSSKKHRPSIRVIQNLPATSTLPMKPRNPTQTDNRVSIAYTADANKCSFIKNSKPLPPRPTSPVQADTPPLRPCSQNVAQGREKLPPQLQRASLPPPPPPPSKPVSSSQVAAVTPTKEQPNASSSTPVDASKTGLESKGQQNERKTPMDIKKQFEAKKPLPVPSARPTSNTPAPNGMPKPAPRPGRPKPASGQQMESRPLASRPPVARASRKNPNFRTLPLNDRSSVKAESKSSEGGKMDWRNQLNKPSAQDDNKKAGNPPLAPEKKRVPLIPRKNPVKKNSEDVDSQQKRPLLPKKKIEDNEADNNKPMSVSEMKKLLESKDKR